MRIDPARLWYGPRQRCHVLTALTRFVGEAAEACIQRYNAFTCRVEELGLDNMVDAKPLLNVRECDVPFFRLLTYSVGNQGHLCARW